MVASACPSTVTLLLYPETYMISDTDSRDRVDSLTVPVHPAPKSP
jgi:hypothetical protein